MEATMVGCAWKEREGRWRAGRGLTCAWRSKETAEKSGWPRKRRAEGGAAIKGGAALHHGSEGCSAHGRRKAEERSVGRGGGVSWPRRVKAARVHVAKERGALGWLRDEGGGCHAREQGRAKEKKGCGSDGVAAGAWRRSCNGEGETRAGGGEGRDGGLCEGRPWRVRAGQRWPEREEAREREQTMKVQAGVNSRGVELRRTHDGGEAERKEKSGAGV